MDQIVRNWNYKREAGQNPYTGIMSFQHFRGGKLYSDIIVRPENHMCETENVECYPVPEDVEEKGREQGYYPDSTIVYIRILWKEFEPEQGNYNYAFIEDIMNRARAGHQTLIFRLMPHSTRARDDVPEWLKKLIPCPERPEGKRVKDSPTDPLFIRLFCRAVEKLGEYADADPVFDAIDVSIPGAWGEGSNLERYSREDMFRIYDTYIRSFPHTQLIAQYANSDMLSYVRERAVIGWRADGLGDPEHMTRRYPPNIERISEFWKEAPVSFESYWWMGEWLRQGWDVDEIIEKTLEWHISSFNPKSIPIPFIWQEKVEKWLSRMGYHYVIDRVAHPGETAPGQRLEITLEIDNVGVAPSYHRIPVYVKLKGEREQIFETELDIRRWMPGKNREEISLEIPEDFPKGTCEIWLSVRNDLTGNVYFATDAPFEDGWYRISEVMI